MSVIRQNSWEQNLYSLYLEREAPPSPVSFLKMSVFYILNAEEAGKSGEIARNMSACFHLECQ